MMPWENWIEVSINLLPALKCQADIIMSFQESTLQLLSWCAGLHHGLFLKKYKKGNAVQKYVIPFPTWIFIAWKINFSTIHKMRET